MRLEAEIFYGEPERVEIVVERRMGGALKSASGGLRLRRRRMMNCESCRADCHRLKITMSMVWKLGVLKGELLGKRWLRGERE